MFDFKRWENVLKRFVMEKSKNYQDNWDFQEQTIDKIIRWYQNNKLSPDEAFRLIDQDFDGIISKRDLRDFLLKILKFEEKEVNDQYIDRLYIVSSSGKSLARKRDLLCGLIFRITTLAASSNGPPTYSTLLAT